MSSPQDQAKDSVKSIAGAAVGTAVAGGVAYHYAANNFIKDALDTSSAYHAKYQTAVKDAAKFASDDEGQSLRQVLSDPKEFTERFERVQKDIGAIKKSDGYRAGVKKIKATPHYQASSEAREALHYLRNTHEVDEVNFITHEGKPAAEIIIKDKPMSINEKGVLEGAAGKRLVIPNVTPPEGAVLEAVGDVKKLFPTEIKDLPKTSWFEKLERSFVEQDLKASTKLVRKESKFGWAFKEMEFSQKLPVVAATVAGLVIGVEVANAIGRGGKHVQAEAERAATPPVLSQGF